MFFLYFFSDNLVANGLLPTHFQYSAVASHLKCQQFSGVSYLYCQYFSSLKQQTRKRHTQPKHQAGFLQSTRCCSVTSLTFPTARLIFRLISALQFLNYPTSWRSEQRWMFSAASVCLFVCQHDDFRTSKHRMMKLGGG